MTEQAPQSYYYEDEIDLRKYILLLFQRWRLIAASAVLAAAAAFLVSTFMTPTYEASVDLATTKLKVEVQFGTEIQTLTEEELAARGASNLIDRKARLEGYAALASGTGIAEKVLPQFEAELRAIDERLLDPSVFVENHVESEVLSNTDLIRITISLPDPDLAARIANAWGQAYEEHINLIYGGGSAQDLARAREQTIEAFEDYQAAQGRLEAYLAQNPIPRLEREIAEKQAQVDRLKGAIQESTTYVSGQELATRRALLGGYYQDLVAIERLLDDAQALQQQLGGGVASPAGSFGDALALIFLRSRAYAGACEEAGVPFALELQTPLALEPGSVTVADVENLVEALRSRLEDTQAKIETITALLLDPPEHRLPEGAGAEVRAEIEALTGEVQTLKAELEAEQAHKRDITQQRDLAWETYSTLAKKETEVRVAAAAGGMEVRLASQAAPPAKPASPKRMRNTVLAGVVGGMLGVFGVYMWAFLEGEEEQE